MGTEGKTVRIGCASAFWGDTGLAAKQLVDGGNLDYLVFDYLAEMTMSIMAGAKLKDPDAGYARGFVSTLAPLLKDITDQGMKVCSNAGGINAVGCARALDDAMRQQGVELKIAVVEGDNLTSEQQNLTDIKEMYTGEAMPERLLSVNAYIGAVAISDAFAAGADIVITGRTVDSAIVVGPLVHEFNWSYSDYDCLAQASLAGHVIECGTQCTGGNFTDWHLVKDGYANMGFPIIDCFADGSFEVTKPKKTGGLVSCDTVAEQVLYEIGDPANYILPDVICDFSNINLEQVSSNRVRVTGAKGKKPPPNYKVSATYLDGFRSSATFLIGGQDARAKGEVVANAIVERVRGFFTKKNIADFSAVNIELLGSESTYGGNSKALDTREVIVQISVQHKDKKALSIFGLEIAQAATAMAPGITGLIGGRPKPTPRICLFSFLYPKENLTVTLQLLTEGNSTPVNIETSQQLTNISAALWVSHEIQDRSNNEFITVPLIELALARSGDKGNHANIGVIARNQTYLPYIEAALTEQALQKYFSHLLEPTSHISIYQLAGLNAINILLENSLGGGGMASLRADPQGKAFAQQLLDYPIQISKHVYEGSL